MAYRSRDTSPDTLSRKTCVIAFLIFAQLLQLDGAVCSPSQITTYTTTIQHLVPRIIDSVTIDTFQTCIVLVRKTRL